jgi:hypothetical protein
VSAAAWAFAAWCALSVAFLAGAAWAVRGGGIECATAAHARGFARGYRSAGKSLGRTVGVALFVWAVCVGSGVGFLWAAADVWSRNVSGEAVHKVVVGKVAAWIKVKGGAR